MRRTIQKPRGAAALAALSLLAVALCLPAESRAQQPWTPPDASNNISNTNTGNVGVGTAAPGSKLEVKGDTSDANASALNVTDSTGRGLLFVKNNGQVSVGSTSVWNTFGIFTPAGTRGGLSIVGDGNSSVYADLLMSPSTTSGIATGKPVSFSFSLMKSSTYGADDTAPSLALVATRQGGGVYVPFLVNTNGNLILAGASNATNGNVGVGTASPGYKLEVAGSTSRNTLALTGDGDAAGYAGLKIQALTTTGIATNRTSSFNLHMRKDAWYGGDGSGPSFIIETNSKSGGFAAPFLITPNNNVILNGGQGASGLSYGNVGVGTTSPAHKLDVAGNVNASGLCLGGTCKTSWAEITGTPSQWTTGGGNIYYAGGNVGIGPGMTAPGEALMVNGKVSVNRAASPGPAEFRIFNGGMVAEWAFRQASSTSHNLNISKAANGVYTDYMTIDTAGNVGVGTAAPASKLHVGSGAPAGGALAGINVALGGNSYVSASNGTVNTFIGSDISAYGIVGTYSNHPLGLRANNALAMTLMPGGNVGVGTAAPAHKLDVAGNVNASGLCLGGTCKTSWSEISGTSSQWTASGSNIYFSSGNVGVGTNAPGARLDVGAGAAARGAYTDMLIGAGGNNPQLEFYGPTKSSAIAHDEVLGGVVFYTNGPAFAPSFFIGNGGNVGVGTNTPAQKLHVFGGNVFHQFSATAGQEYGFYTSIRNNHLTSNLFFDGQWKMITPGKGAFISTAPLDGTAFSVLADNTARAANGAASFTDLMQVKMDGKVGIGIAEPAHKLDVAGNVNASGLCLGGTCKSTWAEIGGTGSQWTGSGSNIYFSSGNVGVGTNAPGARLDVGAGAAARGAYTDMLIGAGGNNPQLELYGPTKSSAIAHDEALGGVVFYTNGPAFAPSFFIGNAGNVGVGTNAPAHKLDVAGSVNASGLCLGGTCKSTWSEISGTGSQWTGTGSNIHYAGGNVGIGAANPSQLLDISGAGEVKARATGTVSAAIQLSESNGTPTWSEWQQYFDRLRLNTSDGTTVVPDVLSILPGGKVGIGTPAPATKLHVAGDITVDGNINAKYQDVAEWVPSTQKLQAGTVVVLDAERSNHVIASAGAYDTKVAGVISAQPGVILGEGGQGRVMVATTGRVRVKVDATRGAIKVGDLLVTGEVEGVAMKSVPVELGGVAIHRPGTIIGKALEPLEKGVGEILVLLSLQ